MEQRTLQKMLIRKAMNIISSPGRLNSQKDTCRDLIATLQVYIADNFDIDCYYNKKTLLCEVCRFGLVERAKMVLEAGADPNKSGEDGSFPLYLAATYGHHKIVRELIEYGADLEMNVEGKTPLLASSCHLNGYIGSFLPRYSLYPCSQQYTECLTVLIEGGARVNFNTGNNRIVSSHASNVMVNDPACFNTFSALMIIDNFCLSKIIPKTARPEQHFTTALNIISLFLDAGIILSKESPPPAFHHLAMLLTKDSLSNGVYIVEKSIEAGYPTRSTMFCLSNSPNDDDRLKELVEVLIRGGITKQVFPRSLSQMTIILIRNVVSLSHLRGTLKQKLQLLGLPKPILKLFVLQQKLVL